MGFLIFFQPIYSLLARASVRLFTPLPMLFQDLLSKARDRFTSPNNYAYNSYDNREGYYQSLLTERSGEALLHWLELKHRAVLNARVKVNFRGIDFKSNPKKVRELLGKPRFVIANARVNKHEIYFYRFRVAYLHSVAALHFLDQRFFMANHSFRRLTSQNYQQIVNVLSTKYGLLPPPECVAVKDSDSNTVLMTDSLYPTVNYVSGHPCFQEYLEGLLDEKDQRKQTQQTQQVSSLLDFL